MSGIHHEIIKHVHAALTASLITNVDEDDAAIAGVIQYGPLQGEPMDPDEARISVTIHENDPDKFLNGAITGLDSNWSDEVYDAEVGGATTWRRRFTIKARCLLENTQEVLLDVASILRDRIEDTLLTLSFSGVQTSNEYVARPVVAEEMKSEMLQGGGPEAYDYNIKVRFEVLTTKRQGV
jgi:hypothetical protein